MSSDATAALGFSLATGVKATIPPPIPQAQRWGALYQAPPSRPLLNMSQGVPGIPPPERVRQALAEASASVQGFGYCPAEGERDMRVALCNEMRETYGGGDGQACDVKEGDIAMTAGCNMAYVASVMCVAGEGHEVILPTPWYFNHQMTLSMLNIKLVPLQTHPELGFLPSVAECATLITPKTKAITLVTPNNPTGAIYPPDLIADFFALAQSHNIPLILDETYRDFILSGPPHALFSCHSPWRNTLIHLFSFSKSYCLPGHRLGAVCASPAFIAPLTKILDTLHVCAPRPPQLALPPLLPSLRPFVRDTARALDARHALFSARLPKEWAVGSSGGYYAFVRHPWVGVSALQACERLAREMGVVTLPAGFFEGPGAELDKERWVRFAVANIDDESVEQVCERLKDAQEAFGWPVEDASPVAPTVGDRMAQGNFR